MTKMFCEHFCPEIEQHNFNMATKDVLDLGFRMSQQYLDMCGLRRAQQCHIEVSSSASSSLFWNESWDMGQFVVIGRTWRTLEGNVTKIEPRFFKTIEGALLPIKIIIKKNSSEYIAFIRSQSHGAASQNAQGAAYSAQ